MTIATFYISDQNKTLTIMIFICKYQMFLADVGSICLWKLILEYFNIVDGG